MTSRHRLRPAKQGVIIADKYEVRSCLDASASTGLGRSRKSQSALERRAVILTSVRLTACGSRKRALRGKTRTLTYSLW